MKEKSSENSCFINLGHNRPIFFKKKWRGEPDKGPAQRLIQAVILVLAMYLMRSGPSLAFFWI